MFLKHHNNFPHDQLFSKEFEVDISDKWSFPFKGNDANLCININDYSLHKLTQQISSNINALDADQQICFYLAIEYMKINDQQANQAAIEWFLKTNETISDIDIKCNITEFLGYCETEYCLTKSE